MSMQQSRGKTKASGSKKRTAPKQAGKSFVAKANKNLKRMKEFDAEERAQIRARSAETKRVDGRKKNKPPPVSTATRILPKRGGVQEPKLTPPRMEGKRRMPRNQNPTTEARKPSATSKEEYVPEKDVAGDESSPSKSTRSQTAKGSPNIESDYDNVRLRVFP
jgi:hypothetical protein